MSYAYRTRKKAIKRFKQKNPEKLYYGNIRAKDLGYLQANWQREVDGSPIGTLDQFVSVSRNTEVSRTLGLHSLS